jgi:hypothetical protein
MSRDDLLLICLWARMTNIVKVIIRLGKTRKKSNLCMIHVDLDNFQGLIDVFPASLENLSFLATRIFLILKN